jgi:ribosomal protein L37AE/L43A
MTRLNQCPCCSEQLLRHIRQGHIYWLCSRCRQEMPNFSAALVSQQSKYESHSLVDRENL